MSSRDAAGAVDAEQRAERISRVYATLSKVDEAMVRVRQRLPLYEEVCRVLVGEGRLRMAWVGELSEGGRIAPVARAGATEGYLDSIRISVLDVPEGRGPTGTAARERQHVFTTDIATDARMGPWREAALAREYRSSAAFPLMLEDRCVAVLTAYSSEPGFFDEEEVALFDRMAADLSIAIEAMAREERRRAVEAELRASEERFRVAAESMLNSLAILSPVRDGGGEIIDFRLRYVNDAYCALVGLERERVVGHRLGELFPGLPGSQRFEVYRRVAATGELCRTEELQLPQLWVGASLASRVLDTVIASMGEELVVSARDVTERKRAEEELAHITGLLEQTEEITKTGGWEYDLVSGTATWTDEVYRVVGLDRASHPPQPAQAIAAYDPEGKPIIEAAFRRLVAEAEPWDLELGLLRGDGQRIWVRVLGRPTIEGGRVVRVSGTISDVTDRRRADEEIRTLNAELEQRVAARTAELERVNHELETFAYSVSHDLRAPLRAVDGFSKVLLDDYAENLGEDGRHYLARVRAGVSRMGTLIEEILQLSRLSQRRFERVPIDMSELARKVVAELRNAEPGRRVAVEIQDGLVAEADLELVRTVLENLFANAFKFTATTERPGVRFGAVQHNGVPVYFVADNGVGFDMARARAVSPLSPASPRDRVPRHRNRPRERRPSDSPPRRRDLGTSRRQPRGDFPLRPDARRAAPRRRRHRRGRHPKVAADRPGTTPIDRGIRRRHWSSTTRRSSGRHAGPSSRELEQSGRLRACGKNPPAPSPPTTSREACPKSRCCSTLKRPRSASAGLGTPVAGPGATDPTH